MGRDDRGRGELSERRLAGRPVWSFFSGAMGLDLGFEAAGLQPSLAVEIDPNCVATIRYNRPSVKVIARSVNELGSSELRTATQYHGDVFLMIGGPPCQSFCPGGKRAALSDPRGNLIYEYLRLIDQVQPRFFILENVANLVTAALRHRRIKDRPGRHWNLSAYDADRTFGGRHDDQAPPLEDDELSGSALRVLLADVFTLGYRVRFGILNAADYGAPQKRYRFIMLGSRQGDPPPLPRPTHGSGTPLRPWRTLRDAIWDLRDCQSKHWNYSERFRRYFAMVPPGGNWRDLPEDVQPEAMGGSYHSGGGRTGFFRRLSWGHPAPTITGKPNRKGSALCHPDHLRPLSVRECARIQGFPDDWEFSGSLAAQYLQVGNAVPIQLGTALGHALLTESVVALEPVEVMRDLAVRNLRGAARNKQSPRESDVQLDLVLNHISS